MRATVSEKGQVTIPKELRRTLGIRAGDVMEFLEDHGRLIGAKYVAADPVDAVYGSLADDLVFPQWDTDRFIEEIRGGPPDAIDLPRTTP